MSNVQSCAPVEYRAIPGFENYRVGDDGSVWTRLMQVRGGRIGDWRQLSPIERRGYLRVAIRNGVGARPVWRAVHQIVLEAFVGPCPDGMEVRHVPDPNKHNNRLTNLQWGTPQQNSDDQIAAGTRVRGSKKTDAKLTEAHIPGIRAMVAEGLSKRAVARQYGVSHTVINAIMKGELWSHV